MYWLISKSSCGYCVAAEAALKKAVMPYHVVKCESAEEAQDFVGVKWGLCTDQTTFPFVVFLNDGTPELLGGFMQLHDHLTEPLLRPDPTRYCLYPIRHPRIFELYKKGVSSFWTPEEVSLKQDVSDWRERLTPDERFFVSRVLAFFAGSDGIVTENLGRMFFQEVQWAEARQFYSMQLFQEAIHSEQYSLLIDTLIHDAGERNDLFEAMQKIPCVARKADWARTWISPQRSFHERLVAFVCVEGILFSGSFCAIFWLKKRGLMPGLTLSNEWIARDEGLHYTFGIELSKSLKRHLSVYQIHDIIEEAVECELEFITQAIPCSIVGMNVDSMGEYIKFVADRVCTDLGYPKIYEAKNPFAFMELLSLNAVTKSNFFERTASEYQRSMIANDDFSLDAAF